MKEFVRMALLAALVVFILGGAYAATPQLISFQGKLTNQSTGNPLSGSYQMNFSIYDASSSGNLLWYENYTTTTVPVNDAIFSVYLGSYKTLNLPFNISYWLETKIYNGATWETLSPRHQLASAPYAYAGGGWYSDGTHVALIDSTDTVGIGTTSPDYKLTVVGDAININSTSGGVALRVNDSEAIWFNGTYFSWGYGGIWNYFGASVGIGTTTPSQKLDVYGSIVSNYTGNQWKVGGYGQASTPNINAAILTGPAAQKLNARATGWAYVASRYPSRNMSIIMVAWDNATSLENNCQTQVNSGWHAQGAVKGAYLSQGFANDSDFTGYSSFVATAAEFTLYNNTGFAWWVICAGVTNTGNDVNFAGSLVTPTNVSIGPVAGKATGANATAIGSGASATGDQSTAVGYNTNASAFASTAIGYGADAVTNIETTAVGYNAYAAGQESTAIGWGAQSPAEGSVSMGPAANATGTWATAVGEHANALDDKSTAFGAWAYATGLRAAAFGENTGANGSYGTAIGPETTATGSQGSTALGWSADATGAFATALGSLSAAGGINSTAIGRNTNASANDAFVIGKSLTNPIANSLTIGAAGSNAFFVNFTNNKVGIGVNATSPPDALFVWDNPSCTVSGVASIGLGPCGGWSSDNTRGAVVGAQATSATGGTRHTDLYFDTYVQESGGLQERVRIDYLGRVGINTTSPTTGLSLGDSTHDTDLNIRNGGMCVDNDGTCTPAGNGNITAEGFIVNSNPDIAENYPTQGNVGKGDVVCILNNSKMGYCNNAYDETVAGVISETAGFVLNGKCDGGNTIPLYKNGTLVGYDDNTSACDGWKAIALKGKVPVKVICDNIQPGDKLVSSEVKGYAMKATRASGDALLGRALQGCTNGTAVIEAWVG